MMKRSHVLIGIAVIVAIAIASPAIGGPSLKKLVKKEVAKQLAGKIGPQGPEGPRGATGAPGEPGADATAEATHLIGAAGEPAFLNGWVNSDTVNFRPAGFFKDSLGVVHLQGMVEAGNAGAMFQLPAGYTSGKGQYFAASLPNNAAAGEIIVSFNGTVSRNNTVAPSEAISLEGISFRVP